MFNSSEIKKCIQPDGSVIYTNLSCDGSVVGQPLPLSSSFPYLDGVSFTPLKVLLVIVAVYVLTSAASFFLYWLDKKRALSGDWRIPEKTLHSVELLGGWPGAMVAQQTLRHKTRKPGYRRVFWVIVLLHLGVWADYSQGFPVGRALVSVVFHHVTGMHI